MPYWPSYSDIRPEARRAYLAWLAGGRSDARAYIGYVFLFFYGLERRLLRDAAVQDRDLIVGEVNRLLGIYGDNHSFREYATKLLDAASVISGDFDKTLPPLSPEKSCMYEMPLLTRVHLGLKLRHRPVLYAEDALRWMLARPDIYLRTPATRCFDEFVRLWGMRFAQRHSEGLVVKLPRSKLSTSYHAASGTFDTDVNVIVDGASVPDIADASRQLDHLRDLIDACTDELDAYSRLLGRKPEARSSVEASLLLPRELLADANSALKQVNERLEAMFNGRVLARATAAQLGACLEIEIPETGRIPAAVHNRIGAVLDALDIGFEPDRRYGPNQLNLDGEAILFRSTAGGPVDAAERSYLSAQMMIEVTVLAAAADGPVGDAEFQAVRAQLSGFDALGKPERTRLLAFAAALLGDANCRTAALKRLAKIAEPDRQAAVRAATAVMLADGHATPDEVRFLERLHKAFGFPVDDVYAALHRGAVTIDEPVVVANESPSNGVRIPAKPTVPKTSIRIDVDRLERVRSDTAAVSEMLAGIFVDEEPAPAAVKIAPVQATATRFEGLDGDHGNLLAVLLDAGTLDRAAFESRARELRLLPDGAVETINEWGFDVFEEAILEIDDAISVPNHLIAKLKKLEARA